MWGDYLLCSLLLHRLFPVAAYFSFSWTLVLDIVRYSRNWSLNSCQPLPWVLLWLSFAIWKTNKKQLIERSKWLTAFGIPERNLSGTQVYPKADWLILFFFSFPSFSSHLLQFLSVPQKIVPPLHTSPNKPISNFMQADQHLLITFLPFLINGSVMSQWTFRIGWYYMPFCYWLTWRWWQNHFSCPCLSFLISKTLLTCSVISW